MSHIPVLLDEVLQALKPKSGDRLLDATVGHGGHAKAFLAAAGPTSSLVGLDPDPQALKVAQKHLVEFASQVKLLEASFAYLTDALRDAGVTQPFSQVLFDLGIGSHQLADETRGFSFTSTGNLTMRYGTGPVPASKLEFINRLETRLGFAPDVPELLEHLSAEEVADMIYHYADERYSRRIGRALKEQAATITTPAELAAVVNKVLGSGYEHGRIQPATRTFQAFRLAVNRELEAIELALPQAVNVLETGGLLAVISFHSSEDRLIKNFMKTEATKCICPPELPQCICEHTPTLKIITKKPIVAEDTELTDNPRARSAKLRVAQKI